MLDEDSHAGRFDENPADVPLIDHPPDSDPACTPPPPPLASTFSGEDVPISRNAAESSVSDEEDPATDTPNFKPVIDDIRIALKFKESLEAATLASDVEPLPPDVLEQIRHPDHSSLSIDDPDNRFSLDVFLGLVNDPESSYNKVRDAYLKRWPGAKMLSYYSVQKMVRELSGVVPVMRDMCENSCMAYTGPLAKLNDCMFCGKSRWKAGTEATAERVPRQQFMTLLISPMIQAVWRTKDGANRMKYRALCTERILNEMRESGHNRISDYTDFFDGSDYLKAYKKGQIQDHDTVLMMSVDGAQLYRNKASDCWMQIWVIMDQSPDVRYRKHNVHPGTFIPGPNKPKHLDSFLFPGLYHLAAVMKEGLPVWDASTDTVHASHPFLALVTADGPGMACLNGFVGHNGKCHCRLYCPITGRHKPGGKTYYPACQKPDNYHVTGSLHDDVDLHDLLSHLTSEQTEERYNQNLDHLVHSPNPSQYAKRRLETGLCKPSIFSGIPREHRLGIPALFPGDCMHLPCLNIPDLLIPLWRGTFECDSKDSRADWDWICLGPVTFELHGRLVADCKPYLPTSFDRVPRDPSEKISSGYKAWEFLLWFYVLGPALFHETMEDKYWEHYCKLVRAMRLMLQHKISREEVKEAHILLVEFCDEFETLYAQRKPERLHFIRPSMHAPTHMPGEVTRIGPGIISSQWTMERTIGNLVEEIRQHSDPYTNLAQRGLLRCQLNALHNMVPDLLPNDDVLPRTAHDVGRGYALLSATDSAARPISAVKTAALAKYLEAQGETIPDGAWEPRIVRWARCHLPTGQDARSRWKEGYLPTNDHRISRCVKLSAGGQTDFAEIHYFFLLNHGKVKGRALAFGSFFGPPDMDLYRRSSKTYYSCEDRQDIDVRVIEVHNIAAVVAMVLDERKTAAQAASEGQSGRKRYFVGEKPGLSAEVRIGIQEGDPGMWNGEPVGGSE
ncbi:hypothetical protein K523DRAFT_252480 [Schizophyllum commune Tattone D]|nr:hypothetical protein K523DRAFT_252480 [Schizophyllum commune Tattone D]